MEKLQTFGKTDLEFLKIIGACLWNVANAPNLPFGKGATTTRLYSNVPYEEKVCSGKTFEYKRVRGWGW